MKKLIFAIAIIVPALWSCSNNQTVDNNSKGAKEVKMESETMDSSDLKKEKANIEIKESTEKLEELLNEL